MNASAICFLQDLNLSSRMPRRKRVLSPLGGAERTKVREGGEGYLVSIGLQRNPSPGLASLAHPLPQGERVFRTPPRAEPWCSQLRIGCGRAARRFPAACAP